LITEPKKILKFLIFFDLKKIFLNFIKKRKRLIFFLMRNLNKLLLILKKNFTTLTALKFFRKNQKQPKEDGRIRFFVIHRTPLNLQLKKRHQRMVLPFSFLQNFSSFSKTFKVT